MSRLLARTFGLDHDRLAPVERTLLGGALVVVLVLFLFTLTDTRQYAGSQRPTYGVRSERIAEVTGGHRHTARQLLVRPAGAAICGMQQPPIGIVELDDVIFKLEYRLVQPTDVKRLVQWQPISRSQFGGVDDLVSCP